MLTPFPAPRPARDRRSRRLGALVGAVLVGTLVLTGTAGPAAAEAPPVPVPPVGFSTPPDAPSPYQGQVSCDPVEKPGATAIRALLRATYGKANAGGTARACSVGGTSEHKEGRAYDWMLNASNAGDKAMADAFLGWLTGRDAQGVVGGNAHRLGVQYVIWNRRTWQAWNPTWRTYTGASPHTDHVHISLSWDGAFKRTSWWTGTAVTRRDIGPCRLYVGEPVPPYSGPNYGSCPAPGIRDLEVLTADFDGDGRTDVATWDRGKVAVRTSAGTTRFPFGRAGDIPVAGDWDGDGRAGVGVVRDGRWLLRDTATPGVATRSFAFGRAGDTPVVGSWAGGRTGVGVHRDNTWHLRTSASGGAANISFRWGRASDQPVAGDWYGSGADSVGVFRDGVLVQAATARASGPFRSVTFGHPSGRAAVGDWDGDGVTTPGTVQGTEQLWTDDPTGAGARSTPLPY